MAKRALAAGVPRRLLSRLLDSPHLAQVVQGLEPKVLHHLVRQCGLEECGEIVALATTEQLTRIFDDDLWRSDSAGAEEEFDADRFGLWLEVLAEVGPDVAAGKLALMDFDFVTGAFSRYLLVVDVEALWASHAPSELGFGDDEPVCDPATEKALEASASYELGGYTVVARREESWDALLAVLASLDHDHHAFFGRLMARCCQISTEYIVDNGGLFEVLTADEQVLDDIGGARAERREQEGYVAPAQAAAFLTLARRQTSDEGRDPVTAGYFRELEHRAKAQGQGPRAKGRPAPAAEDERQVAGFVRSLEARVGLGTLRELPPAASDRGHDRLPLIRAQLLFAQEHDGAAYARRTEELAYLANVLVAGCSFQSRRFRSVEAADAALAACNLGLEHWGGAKSTTAPPDLLVRQDLVTLFRAGWRILYEDVCLPAAARVVDVLSSVEVDDTELQSSIVDLVRGLKEQLKAGTPWREAENLDVIAILDQPSWAIILNLVAECPVVPRGADVPSAKPVLRLTKEFEFISERQQVAWVEELVESLAGRLVGA